MKKAICVVLSSAMLSVPSYAIEQQGMITASQVIAQFDRIEATRQISEFVERADVRKALLGYGLAPDEVNQRLASLSEQELKQLSDQVTKAKAGGDIGGILVVVLLVVLIIFLVKRI